MTFLSPFFTFWSLSRQVYLPGMVIRILWPYPDVEEKYRQSIPKEKKRWKIILETTY